MDALPDPALYNDRLFDSPRPGAERPAELGGDDVEVGLRQARNDRDRLATVAFALLSESDRTA